MSSRPRPIVLVVDDYDSVREMITSALRRAMAGAANSLLCRLMAWLELADKNLGHRRLDL
jgi:CheY-like chemotaxis protein